MCVNKAEWHIAWDNTPDGYIHVCNEHRFSLAGSIMDTNGDVVIFTRIK